jgi:hypothetical protein
VIKQENLYGKTPQNRISGREPPCCEQGQPEAEDILFVIALRMPLSDIAARMSVSQSGLTRSKNRFGIDLGENKGLRTKMDEIEKMLSQ